MAASTEGDFDLEEPKKRKKEPDPKPKDLGPMLMAALAILVLAFFILLVSMATIDSEKRKVVLESLKGTFGVFEGGASVVAGKGIGDSGKSKVQIQFMTSIAMLQDFAKAKGFEKEVFIDGSSKGFRISVSSSALFAKGGATLRSKNYRILNMVKFIIADGQKKFRIRIEGHTDNVPSGSEKYPSNWELSVARAMAALRYVIRDRGINGSQVEAAGYAGYRPIVPNTSPENRARNRRVEFSFLAKEKPKDLDPTKSIDVGGFKFRF